ncbi:MAG: MBOAT family protein [Planctomycetia bacterium]|nr:MBOAT family protein [Planctomycetia bacterium]
MLFNSFDFLLFFAVVFCVQYVLPFRPRNIFLLIASYFFYGCWDWRFLLLIFLSTVIDYFCSLAMDRHDGPLRKRWLVVSCISNLGILGFFKYFNFFVSSADQLLTSLGLSAPQWHLNVVLPVGVSFYTFQALSYTIDVYRRKLKPLRNFLDFALYVTLFPQLVAGPIERGAHLAQQVTRKTPISWADIYDGSWLILKGLFKKAVIADNLAPIVDAVFTNSTADGLDVLLGIYAFAFQIYGDFSGYSDIARGTARWMGYDLMLNFRLPYFAIDPSDFWSRWHISLSSWLRDYLYIPLGGNRGSAFSTYRNLMLTMLLGGLWHGAAWTFILWGAFHGAILVAFRLLREHDLIAASVPKLSPAWLGRVLLMFHLTCVSWLLFRANSFEQLSRLTGALCSPWYGSEMTAHYLWKLLLLCVPLLCVHLAEELAGDLNLVRRLSLLPRALVYATTIIAILTIGSFGGREFIYFQF